MADDNLEQPHIEGFELPESVRKGGRQRGLAVLGDKPGDKGFEKLFNDDEVIDHDKTDSLPEFIEAARDNGFLPETVRNEDDEESRGQNMRPNQMSAEQTVRYWDGYCQNNYKTSIQSFARNFDTWYAKYNSITEGGPAPVYAQRMMIKLISRAIENNPELSALVPDQAKLSEIASRQA